VQQALRLERSLELQIEHWFLFLRYETPVDPVASDLKHLHLVNEI
jgi:hypothetical protein